LEHRAVPRIRERFQHLLVVNVENDVKRVPTTEEDA